MILSHGFPYDVRAYDEVAPILASSGARVIIPYLRGFGPTRFLTSSAMRSGQQAALGCALIGLLDGLGVAKAIIAGFDWGGLASCVAAALWPERVAGTAVSFDNPDFVDVVIHSYRFDFGLAEGDPMLAELERRLATRPKLVVPAVTLDGLEDPLKPGGTADHAPMFVGRHEHRAIRAGHALPYEAPKAFADAVMTIRAWTASARAGSQG